MSRRGAALVAWIAAVVALGGTALPALGSHGTDTCQFDKQTIGAYQNSSIELDGMSSWVRVINPAPNVDKGSIRSIYVYGTTIVNGLPLNHVEIGWKWMTDPAYVAPNTSLDSAPTVFMFRILNGTNSASEGIGSSNPGWGTLQQSSDARLKLLRDATGSDPSTYTGYVDRDTGNVSRRRAPTSIRTCIRPAPSP